MDINTRQQLVLTSAGSNLFEQRCSGEVSATAKLSATTMIRSMDVLSKASGVKPHLQCMVR
jgi:hypothetical protein